MVKGYRMAYSIWLPGEPLSQQGKLLYMAGEPTPRWLPQIRYVHTMYSIYRSGCRTQIQI